MLDPNRSKRAHLFHPENQVFGVTRGRSGTQEPHIKGVPPRVVLSERSSRMKKLMLICFALALVMSLLAVAAGSYQAGRDEAGHHESRKGIGKGGQPNR